MAPLKEPGHLQSAVNVNTALQCAEGTSNYADGAAGKCIDLASSMAWRAPYEQEQSLQHAIICSRESTHCNKRDGLRNLKSSGTRVPEAAEASKKHSRLHRRWAWPETPCMLWAFKGRGAGLCWSICHEFGCRI